MEDNMSEIIEKVETISKEIMNKCREVERIDSFLKDEKIDIGITTRYATIMIHEKSDQEVIVRLMEKKKNFLKADIKSLLTVMKLDIDKI